MAFHRYSPFFVATGLQAGSVILGYYWGHGIRYLGWPHISYTYLMVIAEFSMLAGVLLLLVNNKANESSCRNWVCLGSLLYSLGIVACDPFHDLCAEDLVVFAAVVLAPLVVAVSYLVHARVAGRR